METRSESREETQQDCRIQTKSKKKVTAQINACKEILTRALDGQPEVAEETKKVLLEELLANFEAAVQGNVLVNGQPWEDAADVEALSAEDEAVHLESVLDDAIVETSRRRRTFPRKIVPHVIHALKAQRKVLGLYEQGIKPPEVLGDPDPDGVMEDLSAGAPVLVKQAIQEIKAINSLLDQAEGLCLVLNMKPSHASQQVHREVFNSQSDAPPPARIRQPIKRAVEAAAASEGYVARSKRPVEQ